MFVENIFAMYAITRIMNAQINKMSFMFVFVFSCWFTLWSSLVCCTVLFCVSIFVSFYFLLGKLPFFFLSIFLISLQNMILVSFLYFVIRSFQAFCLMRFSVLYFKTLFSYTFLRKDLMCFSCLVFLGIIFKTININVYRTDMGNSNSRSKTMCGSLSGRGIFLVVF
jgi:hypothetical protein